MTRWNKSSDVIAGSTRPTIPHTRQHLTTAPNDNQSDFDLEEFLQSQNLQFASSLAPTLAYLSVLMVTGLLGNTVVFLVYYKRFKPSTTRTYILAMSVCDLLTNVLSLPADVLEIRFNYTFDNSGACKLSRTVKSLLSLMSACILVAVALDRHRKVCRSFSGQTNSIRVGIILASWATFTVLCTVPYTVLTGPQTVTIQGTNITGQKCTFNDYYLDSLFLTTYNYIMTVIFLLGFIVISVAYTRIGVYLWRHKKRITESVRGRNKNAYRSCGRKGSYDCNLADKRVHVGADDIARTHGCDVELATDSSTDQIVDQESNEKEQLGSQEQDTTKTCPESSTSKAANSDVRVTIESGNNPNITAQTEAQAEPAMPKPAMPETVRSSLLKVLSSMWKRGPSDTQHGSAQTHSTPRPKSAVRKISTKTTWMMFVLTVVLVVVNYLPYLLIIVVPVRADRLVEILGLNFYNICIRTYFISSAINPLVYSICSAKFRQECRRLFAVCMKG